MHLLSEAVVSGRRDDKGGVGGIGKGDRRNIRLSNGFIKLLNKELRRLTEEVRRHKLCDRPKTMLADYTGAMNCFSQLTPCLLLLLVPNPFYMGLLTLDEKGKLRMAGPATVLASDTSVALPVEAITP